MTESSSSHAPQNLERFFRDELSGWHYNFYASNSKELHIQQSQNELIPSENIVSRTAMDAQGGVMSNKYLEEGYPSRLYCGRFDISYVVDMQTINRARKVFGCPFVDVQPYFGAVGNRII